MRARMSKVRCSSYVPESGPKTKSILNCCLQGNSRIELFKSIHVLGRCPINRFLGRVMIGRLEATIPSTIPVVGSAPAADEPIRIEIKSSWNGLGPEGG
jgi:hypothetical protein